MAVDMENFKKGPWKKGLFECDIKLCVFNYFCTSCSLAQIHEKLGNPMFGKPIACIIACCGAGGIQTIWYGQHHMGAKEHIVCGFIKAWLCGICYLHQQYTEHGCTEDPGKIITTAFGPSQIEMS
jgi:Cys-rich protein (TIGR01571 family)